MKFTQLFVFVLILLVFTYCKNDPGSLTVVNSASLDEKQVNLSISSLHESQVDSLLVKDSLKTGDLALNELDQMKALLEQVGQSASDEQWRELLKRWNDFNDHYFGSNRNLFASKDALQGERKSTLFPEAAEKWARLNIDLLKLTGKVRFGDALEILLYDHNEFMFPDSLLRSVIYTHVFDDIYINLIGSSSMEYQHTTGGTVSLTQETTYPEEAEMTLTVETGDTRFMRVYIRIPSWAENPQVSYGNVKYVARPGEYSVIARKWRSGDEIRVALNN